MKYVFLTCKSYFTSINQMRMNGKTKYLEHKSNIEIYDMCFFIWWSFANMCTYISTWCWWPSSSWILPSQLYTTFNWIHKICFQLTLYICNEKKKTKAQRSFELKIIDESWFNFFSLKKSFMYMMQHHVERIYICEFLRSTLSRSYYSAEVDQRAREHTDANFKYIYIFFVLAKNCFCFELICCVDLTHTASYTYRIYGSYAFAPFNSFLI